MTEWSAGLAGLGLEVRHTSDNEAAGGSNPQASAGSGHGFLVDWWLDLGRSQETLVAVNDDLERRLSGACAV
jgi:hypothetical protein